MSSTTETGHAKTVAIFQDLIGFCTSFGASYNPSNPALKLPALNAQLAAANTALQNVKAAKTALDNAINSRDITFKPLRSLATRIVSAIAATEAAAQTIADVNFIKNKIQGRRVKAIAKSGIHAPAAEAEPVRTVSTAQLSFDKRVDNFAQLIATLTAEPKYLPNENELKLTTLNAILTDMRARNSGVINATTAASNARIARDTVLYHNLTGLVDTARAAKGYIKSVFGARSPEFRQVRRLRFVKKPLR